MPAYNDEGSKPSGFLIIAMVFVCIVLIWLSMHKHISSILFFFREIELSIPALFFEDAARIKMRMQATNMDRLTIGGLIDAMSSSSIYVAPFFALPTIFITWKLYTRDKIRRLRRKHTVRSLMESESRIWKTITPATRLNLVNEPATKSLWASAKTEREFAREHGLVKKEQIINEDGLTETVEVFDAKKARQVFIKQLGSRFVSVKQMPPHVKALFACLAAKIADTRDENGRPLCDVLSERMATSWEPGKKMDFSWADKEIEKSINHPLVQEAIKRHAYIYTLMATMMQLTRVGDAPGVYASSQFKWMKTIDRTLWYTINNVGRTAFHVECAGVIAHWLAEKAVGFKILPPQVDNAVSYKALISDSNGKTTKKLIGGLEMELLNYKDDDRLERIFD